MGTDYDYRNPMLPHDRFQGVYPIQSWHFQIQSNDLRLQLFDFLEREISVHRRPNYLDGTVLLDDLRDQFPHQCGIVHNQNFHGGTHASTPVESPAFRVIDSPCWKSSPESTAPASSGRIRPIRSTIAARFRISTTRPSPRMDAPLTRSVVTT